MKANDPFVIAGERQRSADQIRQAARKAAEGFRRLGVREGDAVALLLRNDFAFFEAAIGAGMAGAYPVALNWHATADEARYVLEDCEAKVIVVHRDLLPAVRGGFPPAATILVVDPGPEILAAYPSGAAGEMPTEAVEWYAWLQDIPPIAAPTETNGAAVIYTSGTTGFPKGVRRTPIQGDWVITIVAAAYGLGAPGTVVLMNGPMYHAAPNGYAMMALASGASIVLQPRFDAEDMLRLIETHRITHMHIVPTMFVRLLRLPVDVRSRYDLSSLVHVVHGAAPCPPEIKQAMIEWWGPVIHEYYGSTETGFVTAHGSLEAAERPGTVGRALPGVEIKILGEDGLEVPVGEQGDIFVRSLATQSFDYIGRDDAGVVDGYITVGDIGYLDSGGYLFLCDRRRDMIISGGVNIYPAEVERVLLAIPGVQDCAVFGVSDAEFGESVCAYVQLVGQAVLDVDTIRSELGRTLSRFKLPRHIRIVEDLPREDSGKIFKRKLRDAFRLI